MFEGIKTKMKLVKGISSAMSGDMTEVGELISEFLTPENINWAFGKIKNQWADYELQNNCETAILVRHDAAHTPYIDIIKIENNVPTGLLTRYTINEFDVLVKQLTAGAK